MEVVESRGSGRLENHTVVFRAVPGLACPYALGVIRLDEGPVLVAQLAGWQNVDLNAKPRVELVIGIVRTDPDGTVLRGPMFRPVA